VCAQPTQEDKDEDEGEGDEESEDEGSVSLGSRGHGGFPLSSSSTASLQRKAPDFKCCTPITPRNH
jgi:hypothetical protein